MGPWPSLYQVTVISDGRLGDAAHTDRRITLKARSQLKNGSGRVGEHPTPILAVKKGVGCWALGVKGCSPTPRTLRPSSHRRVLQEDPPLGERLLVATHLVGDRLDVVLDVPE